MLFWAFPAFLAAFPDVLGGMLTRQSFQKVTPPPFLIGTLYHLVDCNVHGEEFWLAVVMRSHGLLAAVFLNIGSNAKGPRKTVLGI